MLTRIEDTSGSAGLVRVSDVIYEEVWITVSDAGTIFGNHRNVLLNFATRHIAMAGIKQKNGFWSRTQVSRTHYQVRAYRLEKTVTFSMEVAFGLGVLCFVILLGSSGFPGRIG